MLPFALLLLLLLLFKYYYKTINFTQSKPLEDIRHIMKTSQIKLVKVRKAPRVTQSPVSGSANYYYYYYTLLLVIPQFLTTCSSG